MKDLAYCARLIKSAYEIPFQTFSSTGFYYEFHGDSLFIAMTGTDSQDDVCIDLSIWPSFNGCHYGFYSRAKSVAPKVSEIIDTYASMKFIPPDFKIILCGHSLSGSTAQVLCSLLRKKYKNLSAISFGAPPVWIFGCAPKIEHIRCYHIDDPVPKLLGWFYRHSQTKSVRIGKDQFGISIKKHYIENYIAELDQE